MSTTTPIDPRTIFLSDALAMKREYEKKQDTRDMELLIKLRENFNQIIQTQKAFRRSVLRLLSQ